MMIKTSWIYYPNPTSQEKLDLTIDFVSTNPLEKPIPKIVYRNKPKRETNPLIWAPNQSTRGNKLTWNDRHQPHNTLK